MGTTMVGMGVHQCQRMFPAYYYHCYLRAMQCQCCKFYVYKSSGGRYESGGGLGVHKMHAQTPLIILVISRSTYEHA